MNETELKKFSDRVLEIRKKMEAPSPKIKPGHTAATIDFDREISSMSKLNYRRSALRYFKNREIADKDETTVQFKSRADQVQTRVGVFRAYYEKMMGISETSSFSDAMSLLDEIESDVALLNFLAQETPPKACQEENDKESMKQRLGRFESKNHHWRILLDGAMTRSVYWPVYLIQRITGCRTVELTHYVFVEPSESNEGGLEWLIHVNTGKKKVANSDPDEKRIRIIKSNDYRLGELEGRHWGIDKQSNYESLFRNTCLRVLKEDFSPYILRYAVAADLRDARFPLTTQAEFLGHQDANTARRYPKGLGRSGREYPATLEVARVKVQPRDISDSLKKRIENSENQRDDSPEG